MNRCFVVETRVSTERSDNDLWDSIRGVTRSSRYRDREIRISKHARPSSM